MHVLRCWCCWSCVVAAVTAAARHWHSRVPFSARTTGACPPSSECVANPCRTRHAGGVRWMDSMLPCDGNWMARGVCCRPAGGGGLGCRRTATLRCTRDRAPLVALVARQLAGVQPRTVAASHHQRGAGSEDPMLVATPNVTSSSSSSSTSSMLGDVERPRLLVGTATAAGALRGRGLQGVQGPPTAARRAPCGHAYRCGGIAGPTPALVGCGEARPPCCSSLTCSTQYLNLASFHLVQHTCVAAVRKLTAQVACRSTL